MKIAAALAVSLLMTQPLPLSPRELLSDVRPLTGVEIAAVLHASQRAIAGETFRLAPGGLAEGPQVLMGREGVPRRIRWAGTIISGVVGGVASGSGETRPPIRTTSRVDYVTITDYTGRTAPDCAGSVNQGDLVVEYKLESPGTVWQTNTRLRDARDFGGPGIAPIFKMLKGAVTLASGELKDFGRRPARALTAVWRAPARSEESRLLIGDPIPNMRGEPVLSGADESLQSLWIDTKSLRPLRWEVSKGGLRLFGFDFKYSSFKIPLPSGVHPPDCRR